ncbi:hypothetical protein SAMN04487894_109130 [Niabella drilacis]|uniref:Uncharacterized protein n=1 Tax=Niabella drilacis (strain DSM 25811 / CCM 8410 / CCUG 62505 / LMG 26954 / E90) TaxID=1285928 RepID=A0A1G6UYG9_NIADE|nr:hypothetical protein SAMN04487894_109130 [Niabella drilacis]
MGLCPDSRRFMGDSFVLNPGRGSTRIRIMNPAFHAWFIKENPYGFIRAAAGTGSGFIPTPDRRRRDPHFLIFKFSNQESFPAPYWYCI